MVGEDMGMYLAEKLEHYVANNRSRQTMETMLSAMGKMEYAINFYIGRHDLDAGLLDTLVG